jgi:hypothetical protein
MASYTYLNIQYLRPEGSEPFIGWNFDLPWNLALLIADFLRMPPMEHVHRIALRKRVPKTPTYFRITIGQSEKA